MGCAAFWEFRRAPAGRVLEPRVSWKAEVLSGPSLEDNPPGPFSASFLLFFGVCEESHY